MFRNSYLHAIYIGFSTAMLNWLAPYIKTFELGTLCGEEICPKTFKF
jgi:hypothetical protein